jgi:hypothetical protein
MDDTRPVLRHMSVETVSLSISLYLSTSVSPSLLLRGEHGSHPLLLLRQAQEDSASRPGAGISLTTGHAAAKPSYQSSSSSCPGGEAVGQRKRLVSTVDDFTDFV